MQVFHHAPEIKRIAFALLKTKLAGERLCGFEVNNGFGGLILPQFPGEVVEQVDLCGIGFCKPKEAGEAVGYMVILAKKNTRQQAPACQSEEQPADECCRV